MSKPRVKAMVGLITVSSVVALAGCASSASETSANREAGAKIVGEIRNLGSPSCPANSNNKHSSICYEFANSNVYLFKAPGSPTTAATFATNDYTNLQNPTENGGWTTSTAMANGPHAPSPTFGGSENGTARVDSSSGAKEKYWAPIYSAVSYGIGQATRNQLGYQSVMEYDMRFTATASTHQPSTYTSSGTAACDGGSYLVCTARSQQVASSATENRWWAGFSVANSPLIVEIDNQLDGTLVKSDTSGPSNLRLEPNAGGYGNQIPGRGKPALLSFFRTNSGISTWSPMYSVSSGNYQGLYIQPNLSLANQDLTQSQPGALGGVNINNSTCDVIAPSSNKDNNVSCEVIADLGSGWGSPNQITFRITSNAG